MVTFKWQYIPGVGEVRNVVLEPGEKPESISNLTQLMSPQQLASNTVLQQQTPSCDITYTDPYTGQGFSAANQETANKYVADLHKNEVTAVPVKNNAQRGRDIIMTAFNEAKRNELNAANTQNVARTEAATVFSKANPLEKIGLRLNTLMSPLGYEYIGGAGDKAVISQIAHNIEAQGSDPVSKTALREITIGGGIFQKTYKIEYNIAQARGTSEFISSPIFEIEASLLGGELLGAAKGIPIIAKALSKPAVKVAAVALGTATVALRAIDIYQNYAIGNTERALGLSIVTAADIGAGLVGYKLASPKPTISMQEIGAVKSKSLELTYSKATGLNPDIKVYEFSKTKTFTPLTEAVSTKDIPGLKAAGYNVEIKTSMAAVNKVKMGGQLKYYATTETGEAIIGKPVTLATELGLRPKFAKVDLIEFKGARVTTEISRTIGGEGSLKSVRSVKTSELMLPSKSINIENPSRLTSKPMKGSLGGTMTAEPRIAKITETPLSGHAITISEAGTGLRGGLTTGLMLPKSIYVPGEQRKGDLKYVPLVIPAIQKQPAAGIKSIAVPISIPVQSNIRVPVNVPVTSYTPIQTTIRVPIPVTTTAKTTTPNTFSVPIRSLPPPSPRVETPPIGGLVLPPLLGGGSRGFGISKRHGLGVIVNPVPNMPGLKNIKVNL